jgi:hypothetical protein
MRWMLRDVQVLAFGNCASVEQESPYRTGHQAVSGFSHRHEAAATIMMVAIMRVAKMSPSSNACLTAARSLGAVEMLISALLRCSCSRFSSLIIGGGRG